MPSSPGTRTTNGIKDGIALVFSLSAVRQESLLMVDDSARRPCCNSPTADANAVASAEEPAPVAVVVNKDARAIGDFVLI